MYGSEINIYIITIVGLERGDPVMNVCGNWNMEWEDKEECRRVKRVGVGGTVRESCRGPAMYQAGEVTPRGRRT